MKIFKLLFLVLFLVLFFTSCTRRVTFPPIATPPPELQNLSSLNNMTQPKKSVSKITKNNVTVEEIPQTEIIAQNSLNNTFNNTFSEEPQENKTDLYAKWRIYGRSTPPLMAVFFDFDSYQIRKDMWKIIQKNAEYLLAHPEIRIQLQGNCDERGTEEYNMALGAKRALEVKKVLVKLGISPSRIDIISFGKDRPLCTEHNEECWSINRRVDFVIE